MDRFIHWGDFPKDRDPPTLEGLIKIAQDFLGPTWKVWATDTTWIVCEKEDEMMSFSMASVCDEKITKARKELFEATSRGFEIYFSKDSTPSVITRQADEFTCALADRYAKILARWWRGTVEWP